VLNLDLGMGAIVLLLLLCSLLSAMVGVFWIRFSRVAAVRDHSVSEALRTRQRVRPPLLTDGEIPEEPGAILKEQKRLVNRIRRRVRGR